ncbi:leucine-rich repeat-containing protein [Trypanosoma equiperdum]|nr:leucine-rich repeat-containing protein [Trypanosoma equiperdum]
MSKVIARTLVVPPPLVSGGVIDYSLVKVSRASGAAEGHYVYRAEAMGCAGSQQQKPRSNQNIRTKDEGVGPTEPFGAQNGDEFRSCELSTVERPIRLASPGSLSRLEAQQNCRETSHRRRKASKISGKDNFYFSHCSVGGNGRSKSRGTYKLASQDTFADGEMTLTILSNSSSPQLLRIQPSERAQQGDGTWEWWYEQVEKLLVTKDCNSRTRLQDIPNRLTRQYDADKEHVELDLSWCFMERSAPYVLSRLLASPYLVEIRWVTALRLDGNYFTDDGFGSMLEVMSTVNETQLTLPLLRHLYLNNMNLDHHSLHGILFYLFPVDDACYPSVGLTSDSRAIAGRAFGKPPKAYLPFNSAPRIALFPSLTVLSLCDNPGIGNLGLIELLRCFLASHYEHRVLPVLDMSRCGIDEVGARCIREYIEKLPLAVEENRPVVTTQRIVLYGNRHSADRVVAAATDDSPYDTASVVG